MTRAGLFWTLGWIAALALLGGEYVMLKVASSSDGYPFERHVAKTSIDEANDEKPAEKVSGGSAYKGTKTADEDAPSAKPAMKPDYEPDVTHHEADLRQLGEQTNEPQTPHPDVTSEPRKSSLAVHPPTAADAMTQTETLKARTIHDRENSFDLTNLSIECFMRDQRPICGRSSVR